mgnify:CR=1
MAVWQVWLYAPDPNQWRYQAAFFTETAARAYALRLRATHLVEIRQIDDNKTDSDDES